jgi:hypothetical protein
LRLGEPRTIEMFGKHVIPVFRNPHGFPSSNDGEDLGIAAERKFPL